MNELSEFLRHNGLMLLAGSSLLFIVGSIGLWLQQSPIQKQRLGELTLLGVLAWLILASVPLPRYFVPWRQDTQIAAVDTAEELTAAPLANDTFVGGFKDFSLSPAPAPVASINRRLEIQQAINEAEDQAAAADDTTELAEVVPAAAANNSSDAPSAEAAAPLALEMPAIEPTAPIHRLSLGEVLAGAYLLGCAACVAWLLLGHALLIRLSRAAVPVEPWLRQLYRSLPLGAGKRRPRLIVTRSRSRAMSWGIWRPTIALSAELCRRGNAQQVRHVLLHELAHVEQRDAYGALLFNAAFVLFFFHPLYWWLRVHVRFAGELIADDWAVAHSSRERYAEELIAIVRGFNGQFNHLGAMTIFQSPTQFYRRMNMLLERETPLATGCPRWWTIAYGLVCVAGVGLAAAATGVSPVAADVPSAEQLEQAAQQEQAEQQEQAAAKEAVQNELEAQHKQIEEQLDDLNKRLAENSQMAQQLAANENVADHREELEAQVAQYEDLLKQNDKSLPRLDEMLRKSLANLNDNVAKIDQEIELAQIQLKSRRSMPDKQLDEEIDKDQRLQKLLSDISAKQSDLESLRSALRNPDRDPGAVSLKEKIDSLKAQADERKQELREQFKRGEQAREVEQKLKALQAQKDVISKKLEEAKEQAQAQARQAVSRAKDDVAAKLKMQLELARKDLKKADDDAKSPDAKRGPTEERRLGLDKERRAIEQERRSLEGRLRELDSRLKDLKADEKDRKPRSADGSPAPREKRDDYSAKKEELKKLGDAAKKAATEKREVEKRRIAARKDDDKEENKDRGTAGGKESSDNDSDRVKLEQKVRGLEESRRKLDRQVEDLQAAKAQLERQVREMKEALEKSQLKPKEGKEGKEPSSSTPERRGKTPKAKGVSTESDDEDRTAGSTKSDPFAVEPAMAPESVPPIVSAPPASNPVGVTPAPAAEPHLSSVVADAPPLSAAIRDATPAIPAVAVKPPKMSNAAVVAPPTRTAPPGESKRGGIALSLPHTDAVALAKEYSDAISGLENAQANLSEAQQRVKQGEWQPEQIERAKTHVKEAQRRVTLLRTIAEGEMEKVQAEIDADTKNGSGDKSTQARFATTIRLLKLVMDDDPSKNSDGPAVNITSAGATLTADRLTVKTEDGPSASSDELRLFKLKNSRADQAQMVVANLFEDVKTTRDESTNTLIVRGPKASIGRIEKLIKQLDDDDKDKATRP